MATGQDQGRASPPRVVLRRHLIGLLPVGVCETGTKGQFAQSPGLVFEAGLIRGKTKVTQSPPGSFREAPTEAVQYRVTNKNLGLVMFFSRCS